MVRDDPPRHEAAAGRPGGARPSGTTRASARIRATRRFASLSLALIPLGCGGPPAPVDPPPPPVARPPKVDPWGPSLENIRPLTSSGKKNGEGYFSPDGRRIIFQGVPEGADAYRMYTLGADGTDLRPVSSGVGKTTCGFFSPDGRHFLYASTHLAPSAPAPPKSGDRYRWDFDAAFDIFEADLDGSNVKRLTDAPGYDAEGSYSPDGRQIVFTSQRDGDLEIYVMDSDGAHPRRLTHAKGYDGGPFFSPDGRRIVFRRFGPDGKTAQIILMNADGSGERPLTRFAAMNWCPFFHPDGHRIVFASTLDVSGDRGNHELFLIRDDGTELTRLTRHEKFDALPSFSPDGRLLLWTSTRWDGKSQLTLADFVDAVPPEGSPEITAEDARRHVTILASDDLDGRGAGTLGGEWGASYVGGVFRRLGLGPAGDDGTYFQGFDFLYRVTRGPDNSLSVKVGETTLDAKLDEDFRPLRSSKSGAAEADAVAVGYGIAVKEGAEDDYAGWEVKGRVAVALDGAPEGWREKHAGQEAAVGVLGKAATAAAKGVRALLIVTPDLGKAGPEHSFGAFPEAEVPVARVSKAFWDRVLAKAGGAAVPIQVSLKTDILRERRQTCNVVGIWPAADSGAGNGAAGPEAVVVGAHYDHLGRGLPGSSDAKVQGSIHHGADDNASGVAGLLEIAQAVASSGRRFPRAIVFVAFGAEEEGLFGSEHYVRRPVAALDRTAAMINLDMIGKAKAKGVSVEGVGTAALWDPLVRVMEGRTRLQLKKKRSGFGPSDHNTFCLQKVPVLYFFTGLHRDYHRPSDTADKIDYDGLAEVARLARLAVEEAASVPARPAYVEVKAPPGSIHGGNRAYLGITPDYMAEVAGVRVEGVQPGGPAEAAGLKAGDVIVRLRETELQDIYDLHEALAASKPGDEVPVAVQREGKTAVIRVKLGKRPEE